MALSKQTWNDGNKLELFYEQPITIYIPGHGANSDLEQLESLLHSSQSLPAIKT